MIGTRQPYPDEHVCVTPDGRQFLAEDGRCVRELLPGDPKWFESRRVGRHWSEWAKDLMANTMDLHAIWVIPQRRGG